MKTSDVVFEAAPWPRGASRPISMALASKVQASALVLKAALAIFWH